MCAEVNIPLSTTPLVGVVRARVEEMYAMFLHVYNGDNTKARACADAAAPLLFDLFQATFSADELVWLAQEHTHPTAVAVQAKFDAMQSKVAEIMRTVCDLDVDFVSDAAWACNYCDEEADGTNGVPNGWRCAEVGAGSENESTYDEFYACPDLSCRKQFISDVARATRPLGPD